MTFIQFNSSKMINYDDGGRNLKKIDSHICLYGDKIISLGGVTMTSFSPIMSKDSTYGVNVSF